MEEFKLHFPESTGPDLVTLCSFEIIRSIS